MKNYKNEININEGLKMLVFSTSWCPDCLYLNNFINEIEKEHQKYEFIYIDADEYADLANTYEILGIPSFIALNNGEILGTLISKERKTKEIINNWILQID
ncbi:MAG: thioredoxin family protein [Mycoplasmatales bacterium]